MSLSACENFEGYTALILQYSIRLFPPLLAYIIVCITFFTKIIKTSLHTIYVENKERFEHKYLFKINIHMVQESLFNKKML